MKTILRWCRNISNKIVCKKSIYMLCVKLNTVDLVVTSSIDIFLGSLFIIWSFFQHNKMWFCFVFLLYKLFSPCATSPHEYQNEPIINDSFFFINKKIILEQTMFFFFNSKSLSFILWRVHYSSFTTTYSLILTLYGSLCLLMHWPLRCPLVLCNLQTY